MDLIEKENQNVNNTFELGVTELADISDAEFEEMSTGIKDDQYDKLPSIEIGSQVKSAETVIEIIE